jgi:hypothetical protein
MTMDENTVVSGGKTDQQAASWTAGGNVYIVSGVVDINGATITSGEAKTNGGSKQANNIYICSAGTVNLNSGKIENTVNGAQNIYFEGGKLNIKGGQIVNTATGSRNIASKASVNGVVNMSGGEIYGCITGTENQNSTLNMSGSAKLTTNGTNVKGNIVSISVMINISKLNPDARIGFQCSGVGGVESTDALGGEKFLANILDDTYDVSMSDLSVYIASDKYNRTYELFIRDGKLYAKQTSQTAK